MPEKSEMATFNTTVPLCTISLIYILESSYHLDFQKPHLTFQDGTDDTFKLCVCVRQQVLELNGYSPTEHNTYLLSYKHSSTPTEGNHTTHLLEVMQCS